jgi:hypothetical protein
MLNIDGQLTNRNVSHIVVTEDLGRLCVKMALPAGIKPASFD